MNTIVKMQELSEKLNPPTDKEYKRQNEKTIKKQLKYIGAIK